MPTTRGPHSPRNPLDAITGPQVDPYDMNAPPDTTPETAALLAQARRLLAERHPDALGAVLGGSAARRHGGGRRRPATWIWRSCCRTPT
ncbi:hypothetical protein V2W30_16575 [Streptomyces sp. Q6]|uniref:Uncharacterized protein n=1 Tax=Streptomyces citrinus TaxID=3118173 RepID=A0ACD5ACJ1_9ACTN